MFGWIAKFIAGRAAKAGAGLISSLGVSLGSLGAVDTMTPDTEMTLMGYVIVGALTGATNWASVYFKANRDRDGRPINQDAAKGLH